MQIDNSMVENAIRPTAIGKKNWIFIVDACRKRGVDPYAYLRDMLTHLPTLNNSQISEVAPDAWAKAYMIPTDRATQTDPLGS